MGETGRKHAVLSASSAKRWMRCAPSARMEELSPDGGSKYAEEGTCAHALCAKKIKEALGMGAEEEARELERLAAYLSEEMEECAEEYASFVLAALASAREATPDARLLVEARVDFSEFVPEGFGTCDAAIVADGMLHIIDFKYGKGVRVSAERNEQMCCYALGALSVFDLPYGIEDVRCTIFQPRAGGISTWQVSATELLRWGTEELAPAAEKAWRGEGEQSPGEWCRFCRAKAQCRALAEMAAEAAAQVEGGGRPWELLTAAELGALLPKADLCRKWAEAVEERARAMLTRGEGVPGWKLVEGRAARKVADPIGLVSALCDAGFDEAQVVKPYEPRGFGELEKLVGKARFAEISAPFVAREKGKPSLAPESDPRKALEFGMMDNLEL